MSSPPDTPDVTSQNTTDSSVTSTCGRVKWFNNKAGYGFVTISNGSHSGEDVFVHHSAIEVGQEQYRYLVQGEYVDFKLCEVKDETHKWQAGEVKGINNGKLMCETRHETRENRVSRKPSEEEDSNPRPPRDEGSKSRPPRDEGSRSRPQRDDAPSHYRVRTRGPGPREGDEWMLVRRRPGHPQTSSPQQREVLRPRARGPYRDGE